MDSGGTMTKARDLASAATALNAVTATEIGYVDGVTSAIQTQLDAKLASATAATTYQAINANVSTTELGYLDGVTSAIQTQLDAKTAKSTLSTTGDIYYASAANTPARLGIGSTGNVLTVAGGIPSWAAPAGGGKVLQVVQAQSTSATTIASTSYTDTSLTASITPSSATSKVLVLFTQVYIHTRGVGSGGASESGIGVKLLRGATDINNIGGANGDKSSYIYVNAGANSGRELGGVLSASYLDSPSTTSSTTYKTQGRVAATGDSGSSTFQPSSTPSTMLLLEIGA
jgi:hypothetical protein